MHAVEVTLALMVAVAILAVVARIAKIPYPIFLVLGGLLLAVNPSVPDVHLEPDLVFLLFMPPLLYIAAFETAIRDVRAYLTKIVSLAVGLVLVTAAAVAVVAHALLPGLGWPAAFALGAIVSPPDAVAATAVFKRLGVPRALITVLEGESLFNDATALVLYRVALAAMLTATFSLTDAALRFVLVAAGGIAIGVVVAKAIAYLRYRLDDPPVEITVSLLTPFAAYLAAEALGVSGVLSTVTAGLYISRWAPRIMQAETRIRGRAVWDIVVFVLNGLVFILIGLQLSTILDAPSGHSLLSLIGIGLVISATLIAVRFAWMTLTSLIYWLSGLQHNWRLGLVISWAGMRGIISLATALALPLETPDRDALIVLTFCVILVTLVGQGLTLPWLVRVLGIVADGDGEEQELHARSVATTAAIAQIEQLAEQWPTHLPLVETLRTQYSHRAGHLNERHSHEIAEDGQIMESAFDGELPEDHETRLAAADQEELEHRQIRRAVIDAEREAVLALRERGEITDEAWRRIERDLDLEELRMEA